MIVIQTSFLTGTVAANLLTIITIYQNQRFNENYVHKEVIQNKFSVIQLN